MWCAELQVTDPEPLAFFGLVHSWSPIWKFSLPFTFRHTQLLCKAQFTWLLLVWRDSSLLASLRKTDSPQKMCCSQSWLREHSCLFFSRAESDAGRQTLNNEWTEFRNIEKQLRIFYWKFKNNTKNYKGENNNHPYFYHSTLTTVNILIYLFWVYFSNIFLVSVKILPHAHF